MVLIPDDSQTVVILSQQNHTVHCCTGGSTDTKSILLAHDIKFEVRACIPELKLHVIAIAICHYHLFAIFRNRGSEAMAIGLPDVVLGLGWGGVQ